MRFTRCLPVAALLLLQLSHADIRECMCDVAVPASLEARECALCKETEKQPADVQFFYLRDTSPTKQHRWLTLPRFHGNHPQLLDEMTPEQRAAYWDAAMTKARELWPENNWGVALNGTIKRTQCHIHIHIGKLIPDYENDQFVVIDKPSEIPLPTSGNGVWVHPAGTRYHAHTDEPAGELKLER